MTTEPAPLLTPEMADAALHYIRNASALQIPIPVPAAHLDMPVALQALADGRTACVRVMSEDECRDMFYSWTHTLTDKWTPPDRCDVWLACARAMGAIR